MSPCPGNTIRLIEGLHFPERNILLGSANTEGNIELKKVAGIGSEIEQTSAVSALLALKKTLHDQLMANEIKDSGGTLRKLTRFVDKNTEVETRETDVAEDDHELEDVNNSDVDERDDETVREEDGKPNQSYISLISNAILSSPDKRLVLSDIYNYVSDNYPYFRDKGPGWRNSIRHNLSLNECFVKVGRSPNGKGHYWAINAANYDDFSKGDFRRRRAQRRARRAVVHHQQMPFHVFPYPFRPHISSDFPSHYLPYQYPYGQANIMSALRDHRSYSEDVPTTDLSNHLNALRSLAFNKRREINHNLSDPHKVLKPQCVRKRGFDVESLLRDDDKQYKALEFTMPPEQHPLRRSVLQNRHEENENRRKLNVIGHQVDIGHRETGIDLGHFGYAQRHRLYSECGKMQASSCSCHCKMASRCDSSRGFKPLPNEYSRGGYLKGYSN